MYYDSEMTERPTPIKESALRELAESSGIKHACAVGGRGGYSIVVRSGDGHRQLACARGEIRLFTLNNASKFLRGIGVSVFEVDSTRYEEARLRKARPDRAEALKLTATKPRQQVLI
jgi:hypothetical protein